MKLAQVFTLLALITQAVSILVVTGPEMGATYKASDGEIAIPITWQDDGTDPTDDEIKSYTFVLCTGPNNAIHGLEKIAPIDAAKITVGGYTPIFDADIAASGYFYVQIYCQLKNGGYFLRYTPRVQLQGMTGSYPASGIGETPWGDQQFDSDGQNANPTKSRTIPYTLQTGKTRYAPMQMQPGSQITVSTWSRRFPTSAVTYYSAISGTPVVKSTVTAGWSYTMSSLVNMASPAPFPKEVGWYPASQRLASASLDSRIVTAVGDSKKRKLKKRRWID